MKPRCLAVEVGGTMDRRVVPHQERVVRVRCIVEPTRSDDHERDVVHVGRDQCDQARLPDRVGAARDGRSDSRTAALRFDLQIEAVAAEETALLGPERRDDRLSGTPPAR